MVFLRSLHHKWLGLGSLNQTFCFEQGLRWLGKTFVDINVLICIVTYCLMPTAPGAETHPDMGLSKLKY